MNSKLIYVEHKTGQGDYGQAWIGYPAYSKSKSTIYFNGLAFKRLKGSGVSGNYCETSSNEEYWISGIKKNCEDRHWVGGGKIIIDSSAIEEYLSFVGLNALPNNLVSGRLANSESSTNHEQENQKLA